jgi:hypothetical protein
VPEITMKDTMEKCTKKKKKDGGKGLRSPYRVHAKHALYQLSYTPFSISDKKVSLGCVPVSPTFIWKAVAEGIYISLCNL